MKTKLLVFAAFVGGAAFGVTSMISCGSGGGTTADAAGPTCDCPAAEPPLAGRLIRVFSQGVAEPATTGHIAALALACPPGTVVLSGSCTSVGASISDVLVQESGIRDQDSIGWSCVFKNTTSVNQDVQVGVLCLKTAP